MRKILGLLMAVCLLAFGHVTHVQAAGEPIHVKIGPNRSSVTLSSPSGIYKNGQFLGNSATLSAGNVVGSDEFSSPIGYLSVQGKNYRGSIRFNSRLAIRGVPRLRRAISMAPEELKGIFKI